MSTDIAKKATNVLNDGLVASGLNIVVPEEAHVVLAVSDQIETLANGCRGETFPGTNPLEGMIESADFTGVVGRTKGPDSIWIRLISDHSTPARDRGGAEVRVI